MTDQQKKLPSHQQQTEINKQFEGKLPPAVKVVLDNDAEQLVNNYSSVLKLSVGDKAPLFELPNAIGETGTLENL